jgi:hypothetical protein
MTEALSSFGWPFESDYLAHALELHATWAVSIRDAFRADLMPNTCRKDKHQVNNSVLRRGESFQPCRETDSFFGQVFVHDLPDRRLF